MDLTGTETRQRIDFGPVAVFLGVKNGKYPDSNQLVVEGSQMRVAIDSSKTSHLVGPMLDEADLLLLSHSHEDHMSGLGRLSHIPVEVHEADLAAVRSWEGLAAQSGYEPELKAPMLEEFRRDFAYAPRPDATGFSDGHRWDLGGVTLQAVHLPGHTPGHCGFLVEETGFFFVADIDLSSFGPFYGEEAGSHQAFRRSIQRLRETPAKIWLTGHHKGIYTDRANFLQDLDLYEAKIDQREARLLAYLAEGPLTLEAMVARRLCYPLGFRALWLEGMERRVIRRHLEDLIAAGQVGVAEGLYYAL